MTGPPGGSDDGTDGTRGAEGALDADRVRPPAGTPDRPEIVVRLSSGLGNQLFQIAAAHTVADALGGSCTYARGDRRGRRPVADEILDVTLPRPSPRTSALVGLTPTTGGFPGSRVRHGVGRRLARRRGEVVVVRQRQASWYDPFDVEAVDGASIVLLDGCFQHPSFFAPSLDHVVALVSPVVERWQPAAEPGGLTVLSFRRGDFLFHGWALDAGYYERALDVLGDRAARAVDGAGHVVVIGDDPLLGELALDWLRARGHTATLPESTGVDPVVRDLALLARADRVVMSNSTFCWWGVMAGTALRPHRQRVVVAPRTWLPGNGPDLGHPEWVQVDNGWNG